MKSDMAVSWEKEELPEEKVLKREFFPGRFRGKSELYLHKEE